MALIKCPECGNQVSNVAVSCPKCGLPIASTELPQQTVNVEVESGGEGCFLQTLNFGCGVVFIIIGIIVFLSIVSSLNIEQRERKARAQEKVRQEEELTRHAQEAFRQGAFRRQVAQRREELRLLDQRQEELDLQESQRPEAIQKKQDEKDGLKSYQDSVKFFQDNTSYRNGCSFEETKTQQKRLKDLDKQYQNLY